MLPSKAPQDQKREVTAAERARGTAAEFQWIRSWRNAVQLLEHTRYPDRAGIALDPDVPLVLRYRLSAAPG